MSYAQRRQMGSNRTVAIIIVALIHIVLGYAIVTGLAYNVLKKTADELKTFDVEDEPPPPEEPPPPPENTPLPPPPQISAPPPLVRIETQAPQLTTTPIIQPPVITPTAPPAPPAPPAPRVSQAAAAKGDVRTLFSSDDYPDAARDSNATGTARARLEIGTNGRVVGCTVTQSTGNSALDRATCSVLTRRARFTPAKDQAGNPISDSYNTPPIRWQLQD